MSSKDKTPPNHFFLKDAEEKAERSKFKWYSTYLMKVLYRAKENNARDIDATIARGKELMKCLDEKVELPVEVPLRTVPQSDDISLMKPIEPRVLDMFYKSTEKGGAERYLHERYKTRPEDRFYYRVYSNWDYGWQQKMSRVPPRDVNRGHCAVLKHTFYRSHNVAPDPPHYAQPSGGQVSICSEYSCSF